jgi:uncharacterized repeat protein (TIGR01451 family)
MEIFLMRKVFLYLLIILISIANVTPSIIGEINIINKKEYNNDKTDVFFEYNIDNSNNLYLNCLNIDNNFTIIKKVWDDSCNCWKNESDFFVGDRVTYNISVFYKGNDTITAIILIDIMPNDLGYKNNANPPEENITYHEEFYILWWNITDVINKNKEFFVEFDAEVNKPGIIRNDAYLRAIVNDIIFESHDDATLNVEFETPTIGRINVEIDRNGFVYYNIDMNAIVDVYGIADFPRPGLAWTRFNYEVYVINKGWKPSGITGFLNSKLIKTGYSLFDSGKMLIKENFMFSFPLNRIDYGPHIITIDPVFAYNSNEIIKDIDINLYGKPIFIFPIMDSSILRIHFDKVPQSLYSNRMNCEYDSANNTINLGDIYSFIYKLQGYPSTTYYERKFELINDSKSWIPSQNPNDSKPEINGHASINTHYGKLSGSEASISEHPAYESATHIILFDGIKMVGYGKHEITTNYEDYWIKRTINIPLSTYIRDRDAIDLNAIIFNGNGFATNDWRFNRSYWNHSMSKPTIHIETSENPMIYSKFIDGIDLKSYIKKYS